MKFRSFSMMATLVFALFVAGSFAQTRTSVAYKYTPVDYPGAATTSANGINNGNVIVGSYLDSSNVSHGFKYANGAFTGLNFPGSATTTPMGISDIGDVVGSYQLSNGSNSPVHGFLLHNGNFTTIDDPKTSGPYWSASTSLERLWAMGPMDSFTRMAHSHI
jgi:hypothetical protein